MQCCKTSGSYKTKKTYLTQWPFKCAVSIEVMTSIFTVKLTAVSWRCWIYWCMEIKKPRYTAWTGLLFHTLFIRHLSWWDRSSTELLLWQRRCWFCSDSATAGYEEGGRDAGKPISKLCKRFHVSTSRCSKLLLEDPPGINVIELSPLYRSSMTHNFN